eukprot:TRINITY_DN2907_c2_g2_i8.p1 TRINITY_DN2907_c2_g2~~TRINITY_DN2907_c2_g2_i8.p1  ORF type:complete len:224 (+),score=94.26 TRINITY_DN2907_c2_g2_i8:320-991(+)
MVAAFNSLKTAIRAAQLLQQTNQLIYAICRPPGHHAGYETAAGFCYFNNSAGAAEYLIFRQFASKVAILDIDVHHGNGTQEIFYERNDVLTISIHGDPTNFYPFWTGYENEIGNNAGKGYNYNFPLAKDTNDEQFQQTIQKAINIILNYSPNAIILALGFDTYENDPFSFFKITTNGFKEIAKLISSKLKPIPIIIIQEGGYNCNDLGQNCINFLNGFEEGWN